MLFSVVSYALTASPPNLKVITSSVLTITMASQIGTQTAANMVQILGA